jgi:hypothetical protein
MAGVKQAPQHYCFNLVELAKDNGTIGHALRTYPNWFLQAADKDAEWKTDYQRKHQDPNRLPFPDPWQFLLDAPAVSPNLKIVFRAAQSQLKALPRLARIALGEATLNTDWIKEMEKAKNKQTFMRAANKVAAARAKYDLFKTLIQSPDVDPQFRQWGQRQIEKAQKERRKRGKGKKIKPLPRGSEVRNEHKRICALIHWWVRGPNDAPGLMFFRNEALTEFLKIYLDNKNLSPAAVKKTRQKLGLIPASNKNHFVWNYSFKATDGEKVKSVGRQRNGKNAFTGCLQKKPH